MLRLRTYEKLQNLVRQGQEYRALRASVLRLWTDASQPDDLNLEDVIRFNEAIGPSARRIDRVFWRTGGSSAQLVAWDAGS